MKLARYISSILVIYALLLNGLVMAAPKNMIADFEPKQMSATFGEKVFICTPDGYKWMSWADLEKEKGGHHKSNNCKFCDIACKGMDSVIGQSQLTLTHTTPQIFASHEHRLHITAKLISLQARSPPYYS